ncbi:hypothetical protein CSA56_16570 [candidate division KSB3 bacterium]|uniref:histidine kinase n=1 Tax=candidate division KSB3 bacterium TaxID=2044937 RepID=A0A2G6K8P5_9BACT|nr:MAG: hypothetical protein CSA56_16570 [candidate division KSB3 bacterium]
MEHPEPSVLIIEDNPSNLSVLFNLLSEAGFEVMVSPDGDYALTAAQEGQPDVILLDVMLCGIDGFEICRRLKASEKTQHIPIIFMTALTSTADKVKGFELGAVDYITKPFEPEEVLVRIKTHLTIQRLQVAFQIKNDELSASLERERELNMLKSRFISIASHEFRTPLSSILFSQNILKRYSKRVQDPELQAEMQEEFNSIKKAVQKMTTTLDDVLILSKSESGRLACNPTRFDIISICRKLIQRFRLMAKNHQVVLRTEIDELHVFADPKLMENVLSNLLSNAMKYSPAGGTILCELTRRGRQMLCAIQDEGIGIAEEDLDSVFEPFYRGSNASELEGTGLGLSIVKQFMELQGGMIWVESEMDRGTTFMVSLPLSG